MTVTEYQLELPWTGMQWAVKPQRTCAFRKVRGPENVKLPADHSDRTWHSRAWMFPYCAATCRAVPSHAVLALAARKRSQSSSSWQIALWPSLAAKCRALWPLRPAGFRGHRLWGDPPRLDCAGFDQMSVDKIRQALIRLMIRVDEIKWALFPNDMQFEEWNTRQQHHSVACCVFHFWVSKVHKSVSYTIGRRR